MSESIIPSIGVPENLAFDDSPVLPDEGQPREPTPTNVLQLWRQDENRSALTLTAVAAIVAVEPECLDHQEIDELDAFLKQILEKPPKSAYQTIQLARCQIALRRQDFAGASDLLESLPTEGQTDNDRRRGLKLRVEILRGLGKQGDADRLHRRLEIDDLLNADAPPLRLRSQALELLKEGNYAESERIYLHLVKRDFELGSTHCHLARVYILLKRCGHAFRHVDLAERHCRERSYVRARTIFLRILQAYLRGQSTDRLLKQLRTTLAEPGAFESWTMEPVIEQMKGRLLDQQVEILEMLVRVLSSVTNLSELDTITSLDVPSHSKSHPE